MNEKVMFTSEELTNIEYILGKELLSVEEETCNGYNAIGDKKMKVVEKLLEKVRKM